MANQQQKPREFSYKVRCSNCANLVRATRGGSTCRPLMLLIDYGEEEDLMYCSLFKPKEEDE